MAVKKISTILDIERNREEISELNVIHLFRCGMFYRAYNWSAWLLNTFLQGDKPLSTLHRKFKSTNEDFIFVGFPVNSFEKFIPSNAEIMYIGENQLDINISLPNDISYEDIFSEYEAWKGNIIVNDTIIQPKRNKGKKNKEDISDSPSSITTILTQILSYPLEAKTPIENIEFISKLKTQLSSLI